MSETDEAELALAGVAADLIESIALARAAEISASGVLPAPPSRQKDLPAIRQDKRWCAYCGASGTSAALVPGPDKDWLGEAADVFCADQEACIARNRRRHGEGEIQQVPAQQPEPAQEQPEQYAPPGWQASQYGAYDVHGQWHPPVTLPPAWHPRAHLISGGADMSHTIAGGAHMGHAMSGMARGQGGPYIPPGGSQGHQDGQGTAAPAAEPPEAELDRRGLYQAARGVPAPGPQQAATPGHGVDLQMQAPELPEGAPLRPGQQPRRQPRRRGRAALRYSPRRPARKPQHPGVGGSDSFPGGGADTGGPSGGSSET